MPELPVESNLWCHICYATGNVSVVLIDPHTGPFYLLADWPKEIAEQSCYKVPCPECGGTGLQPETPGREKRQRFPVVLEYYDDA